MRVCLLIFSTLLILSTLLRAVPASGGGLPMRTQSPPRIVSTSLCSDAYVLFVFKDEDIAALSWQADSPLSLAGDTLRQKPKARDEAETLLALTPSLVVFGPGEGAKSIPLLDKAQIAHISLGWAEDRKGIQANVHKLVQRKKPGRAKPNMSASEESLRVAHLGRTASFRPKILYLIPSGMTAGPGTYVDMIIKEAGGENIITTPGWQTPDIETLAGLKPDLIVTSFFKDGYDSVNAAAFTNKVLADKIRTTRHINVPGRFWPCANPYIDRAKYLIAQAVQEIK